ncbi:hypothetical protein AKJ43_03705 [candidate division MSBL1 archaeon SCGC-AAA261D19]|uniref:A-type ATP synthase subunit F n=1 Tax=candidate division MSBL1 archaeon SCGC-AAA261D19 TaxID=1698273 RepID=A0A133V3P9_9EURY|nr:hypothetical protein AKJ43_03705 [candidate division MSBL1 archaeon SCGC-AAA261D19]
MKIASITDSTTAVGLRLGGIKETHEAEDIVEAGELFEELVKKEIGILIITEKLAQGMRKKINKFTEEKERPIIAEIPDKGGPIPERKEVIRTLIKRAVGVEIKR